MPIRPLNLELSIESLLRERHCSLIQRQLPECLAHLSNLLGRQMGTLLHLPCLAISVGAQQVCTTEFLKAPINGPTPIDGYQQSKLKTPVKKVDDQDHIILVSRAIPSLLDFLMCQKEKHLKRRKGCGELFDDHPRPHRWSLFRTKRTWHEIATPPSTLPYPLLDSNCTRQVVISKSSSCMT